jgi:polyphosphate kinase
VEQLYPLRDRRHRARVRRLLDLQLSDTANAWDLKPDGSHERVTPKEGEEPFDSQAHLLAHPF